ncbi:MAG: hypothetical protein ABL949_01350 [Fimbriimonadaceae bacterium]
MAAKFIPISAGATADDIITALGTFTSEGGTIHFEAGTYTLNKAIPIPQSNIRFVGDGMRASVFEFVSSGWTGGTTAFIITNFRQLRVLAPH